MTELKQCEWKENFDGDYTFWETSCGEDFCLLEGTLTVSLYNYCPNCGGKIMEQESE